MPAELNVLCAGAVKGLVLALQGGFEAATGLRLHSTFGAVGAIRDALRAGSPCDVFIASDAMIGSLQTSGELGAGTQRAIGNVQTAIAVKASAPAPAIGDAESLKAALLAASAIYFPDATLSTAGAHVATVLERLGLRAAVSARLRMFANGATAMRELARADDNAIGCTQATEIRYTPGLALVGPLPPPFALATVYGATAMRELARADDNAIGCTQATEIRYTPGLALVGPLPPPFALATVYGAAVAAAAHDGDGARKFIELLAGRASASLRRAGGFDELAGSDA